MKKVTLELTESQVNHLVFLIDERYESIQNKIKETSDVNGVNFLFSCIDDLCKIESILKG